MSTLRDFRLEVPDYIQELLERYSEELQAIVDGEAGVVMETATLYSDLAQPDQNERFGAALHNVVTAVAAGVPVLVMNNNRSAPEVGVALVNAGALVIEPPRPGLATPHIDACLLILAACQKFDIPEDTMPSIIKCDAEKAIFEYVPHHTYHGMFLMQLLARLEENDLVWVERSGYTMTTMLPIGELTERMIARVVRAELLELPFCDLASGVFAMRPRAAVLFTRYPLDQFDNDWRFLVWLPYEAFRRGYRLDCVLVDFVYRASEEMKNPTYWFKRLEQLVLMLRCVLEIRGTPIRLGADQILTDTGREQRVQEMLGRLSMLVAQAPRS